MSTIHWDIRREGRAWSADEIRPRMDLTPEHFEVFDGKLFWTDEERENLLAILLENVGVDRALRLAPAAIWREAIAELP